MKCAILQPSYLPWRGYFHQIQKVDVFVFYDDVQYDKHGWRNRNRIKAAGGSIWLTVPVHAKGNVSGGIPIHEIRVANDDPWRSKHWASLQHAYSKAPHFGRYRDLLASFYASAPERLVDLTIPATIALARELGITKTRFVRSSELAAEGSKTGRILAILRELGATEYLSGPSAKSYLDEAQLAAAGVSLEYMTYDYPEYAQLHPPFDPHVSIVDTLVHLGPDAGRFIWGPRP